MPKRATDFALLVVVKFSLTVNSNKIQVKNPLSK